LEAWAQTIDPSVIHQPKSYFLAAETACKQFAKFRASASDSVALAEWLSATTAGRLFGFISLLFCGQIAGFRACDAAFHDLDHTMQAALAVLDLLAALESDYRFVPLRQRDWELALAAVLFHDTGYLKRTGDNSGSGAKYSVTHVGRSCFAAWDLLPELGFSSAEIRQIQHAICTTSAGVKMDEIGFSDTREWLIGAIVGTGDLIGQMAADDYPERLPGLYLEFREASHFSRIRRTGLAAYGNLRDLLQGTESFYSDYVLPLLEREWVGLYHVLADQDGRNGYLDRIKNNVRRATHLADLLCVERQVPDRDGLLAVQ
jgi:hypothetical protein